MPLDFPSLIFAKVIPGGAILTDSTGVGVAVGVTVRVAVEVTVGVAVSVPIDVAVIEGVGVPTSTEV